MSVEDLLPRYRPDPGPKQAHKHYYKQLRRMLKKAQYYAERLDWNKMSEHLDRDIDDTKRRERRE